MRGKEGVGNVGDIGTGVDCTGGRVAGPLATDGHRCSIRRGIRCLHMQAYSGTSKGCEWPSQSPQYYKKAGDTQSCPSIANSPAALACPLVFSLPGSRTPVLLRAVA